MNKSKVIAYREEWLTELAKMVVSDVLGGFQMYPYRITCGWPVRGGMGQKVRVLGECHSRESSTDGVHEIFISPALELPEEVSGTAVHELVHVAAGIPAGHKGVFIKIRNHIGLTKNKPTQAQPGEALANRLKKLTEKLGPYPHKKLVGVPKPIKPKSSTTLICDGCGCRVSITMKWLDEVGPPTCACGSQMIQPS